MTFLSPSLLWFLGAVSVPIIIHLLNKRRHKTLPWAAMQFLLKATRESRGKKKLHHILILTCRALGMAAVVFAASRPIVSGLLGWGVGSLDTVVLVLDRSASMELRAMDGQAPKRELVIQKIVNSFPKIGNPRLVLIDSVSGKPQEISSPDVLAEISDTKASDTTADIPSLISKAIDYTAGEVGRAEIWVASDMQYSNWHPQDVTRWAALRASMIASPQKTALRILSLTEASSSNATLRLISSRRSVDGLLLDLEIVRNENSRTSLRLPVSLHLNRSSTEESLSLSSQSLRFQKRITISKGHDSGHGWLSIPADGNRRDNVIFFAYSAALPCKSLIVSSHDAAADYLALAAAPPGFEKQSCNRIEPAAFMASSHHDLSLILWAAPLPDAQQATILHDFVSKGGQLVFLPSDQASKNRVFEMSWDETNEAESGKFFILEGWEKSDGPMRDGLDGTPLPAENMRAIRRAIPRGDSAVMARWKDGEPFLTRKIVNRGTVWFLATTPDYGWSNLGDADVLLPLLQRLIQEGAKRFDSSYFAELHSEHSPQSIQRIDDYSKEKFPSSAGVFQVNEKIVALNRPLSEDDLEIVSNDALEEMLGKNSYRLFDQATRNHDSSLSTDMWRTFLIAMLFFLISEAVLCLPKKAKA